ncbi:hypothetical protein FHS81_002735 [Pseudochelatococcus contaminans]|uniref:Uncharacterized protein n=1 Tax=Pseudochelatococcus contaminans TaxID=1538103 RepID=A0A7W6EI30_9HYPH|nr:hypothetical protein [Pseudochelatococcus contaminans]
MGSGVLGDRGITTFGVAASSIQILNRTFPFFGISAFRWRTESQTRKRLHCAKLAPVTFSDAACRIRFFVRIMIFSDVIFEAQNAEYRFKCMKYRRTDSTISRLIAGKMVIAIGTTFSVSADRQRAENAIPPVPESRVLAENVQMKWGQKQRSGSVSDRMMWRPDHLSMHLTHEHRSGSLVCFGFVREVSRVTSPPVALRSVQGAAMVVPTLSD